MVMKPMFLGECPARPQFFESPVLLGDARIGKRWLVIRVLTMQLELALAHQMMVHFFEIRGPGVSSIQVSRKMEVEDVWAM